LAQAGLAFDQMPELVEMGPVLVGGWLGESAMVVEHTGQVQVLQILLDGV
jgi:hypothetical protein